MIFFKDSEFWFLGYWGCHSNLDEEFCRYKSSSFLLFLPPPFFFTLSGPAASPFRRCPRPRRLWPQFELSPPLLWHIFRWETFFWRHTSNVELHSSRCLKFIVNVSMGKSIPSLGKSFPSMGKSIPSWEKVFPRR